MIRQGDEISLNNLDALVEHHKGFIISTISSLTGKYVNLEHDDAYIIALEGFAEGVKKYDNEKGNFLSYVRLVMESRLKNYLIKESKRIETTSLETMQESGFDLSDEKLREEQALREEIKEYARELEYFGLDMETLADTSPKHKDTRETAIGLADEASKDSATVEDTYSKRKLPIRAVARLCGVTEKIVKTSKNFILAAMIIFVKKYPALSSWVKTSGGVK